ncbi:MAG: putative sporulation-specific glycosylase YdhD [Luteibacter sp.]|uniref:glycosyl hydrolase family 18 protein n=1 Tax=Luteibacter sp. TaxID=1886636 RepID=UPI001381243F|nr:glycosyl hydrolase family 18 protein [Luteibacter sp.]KAF1003432.1 MAG: putative sporulation-specific glycosylase YdhD [Luteibacter sp.]
MNRISGCALTRAQTLLPLALLASFTATAASGAPSATPVSYIAYYEQDGGPSSKALHDRNAYFNGLATDSFAVRSTGKLTGDVPLDDLRYASGLGIKSYAVVSNFAGSDFDGALAHSVIASSSATNNFIASSLQKLAAGNYTGLNIDFESVARKDRRAYTAFVTTVAQAMHAKNYSVVVSIPAMTQDDPSSDWTGAFDLAALGQQADIIQLMTYDENGSWSDAGPVAGLDWMESAVQYATSVVPAGKVSLGIPAYGYDWNLANPSANAQISWKAIAPLLASSNASPEWDDASSSPHFHYATNGQDHVVWYENARSLQAKMALVPKYGLSGASVYALGMEDRAFWESLEGTTKQ